MQQPCELKKSHENRKENEHVENPVIDVATAVRHCKFVRRGSRTKAIAFSLNVGVSSMAEWSKAPISVSRLLASHR